MQDITHARTGDIVAIAGLKDVTTGDTLCDDKHPIVLERMDFPDPVIKVRRLLTRQSSFFQVTRRSQSAPVDKDAIVVELMQHLDCFMQMWA